MRVGDYWYKNAVVYGVDVGTYMDGNGDGIGDFIGLTRRLDHIHRLGANCIWLLPFFPSPNRDNGYDVSDYYGVDPRHGTLGDFVTFLRAAEERGIRVLIDLVVNHTSDQHPWFQAARRDRDSVFHDFYVWADDPPATPPGKGTVFPGVEDGVWTWDDVAEQYYYHRFYHFEPGLCLANPRLRDEIKSIVGFWMQLGIAGVRVDAASHMIERKGLASTEPADPHGILRDLSRFVRLRRGDAVLLAETDVDPRKIADYFGGGDEMQLLFNFLLDNYVMLGLARGEAEPIIEALELLPKPPEDGQFANFLRNLDELDLERLTEAQRDEVYAAFAPKPEMRIYGRGIRRRLAPMLGGDGARLRMAWSLLFSLPGTPVLVYGDEIGMGENLDLPERNAVRTPMQWDAGRNAGFSTADADDLPWPVVTRGRFGHRKVNVADQRRSDDSLLRFMESLVRTRLENPALGAGTWAVVETGDPNVLAHRCWSDADTIVAVHNLSREERTVDLGLSKADLRRLTVIFGDEHADPTQGLRDAITLEGYGYRWLRLPQGGATP